MQKENGVESLFSEPDVSSGEKAEVAFGVTDAAVVHNETHDHEETRNVDDFGEFGNGAAEGAEGKDASLIKDSEESELPDRSPSPTGSSKSSKSDASGSSSSPAALEARGWEFLDTATQDSQYTEPSNLEEQSHSFPVKLQTEIKPHCEVRVELHDLPLSEKDHHGKDQTIEAATKVCY